VNARPPNVCQHLDERYFDLQPILVDDALYANAPHIRQITGYGWFFVLNVKPDSHQSLEKQFAGRRGPWTSQGTTPDRSEGGQALSMMRIKRTAPVRCSPPSNR
jgi:hypothetical protein